MQTVQIVGFAATLLNWMDTNKPDEREPIAGGQTVGSTLLAMLAASPVDASTRPVDLYGFEFAAQVLKLYGTHEHAVLVVPTPQQAALDTADAVLKAVADALAAQAVQAEPAQTDPPVQVQP